MRNVAIVTDGSCDLPEDILKKYHIFVVPFNVILGSTVYKVFGNFGTISKDEFYTKIMKEKIIPSTSLPPPKAFIDTFQAALKEAKEVVAILLSSELSATYNSAKMALNYFENDEIHLIDSRVAASTLGLLAIEAAKLALANASVAEIISHVNSLIPQARLISILDNVEATYRSGRISWGRKFLTHTFKLHPILNFEDGRLVSAGVIHGSRKKIFKKMLSIAPLVLENAITDTIFILHVRSQDKALKIKEQMEKTNTKGKIIRVHEAGPVIGVHVGLYALAYMYIGDYNSKWLL
ncbi:MAG: DegV family protein [Candidatus Heimdallarchaeota archaeon]|nr:DegV family protein [Candidatus Heimdallarchaeota archaeon]